MSCSRATTKRRRHRSPAAALIATEGGHLTGLLSWEAQGMSTPSFKLPATCGDQNQKVKNSLELAIQSVIDAFYDEIGGIVTGLLPAGEFDASGGSFPEAAIHGTYYFVRTPGTVDGEIFTIGDWLVPLLDDASTDTYAQNWVCGKYSKVVAQIYEDTRDLLASIETPRGEGSLWQTRNGFRYCEQPTDAPNTDYQLTTAAPAQVKLAYQPDQEVNVLALCSSEDQGDIAKTMRRAAAAFPGKVLRVPPGNYSVGSIFEFGDLNTTIIRSDGANFVIEEDIVFGRAAPPVWEEIQRIAPIDTLGYWGMRRVVECTNGAAYAVGDIVAIVAENKVESTRSAEGSLDYRMGFMARIEAITDHTTITLDRAIPIDWAFTKNPRMGRMPRRRLDWKGGVIGYEKGHDSAWHGYTLLMYGMSDVDVQIEIEHTYNAAIRPVGCFEPRIIATGRDLLNNEGNLNYGYLVSDSSQGSNVNILAGRNRHGYTTDQPLVIANSNELHLYGATSFGHITGQSHGNSQAGFDTHHGSAYINFHNIFMSGGVDGGGQLVLRGVGHRVSNCFGINGKNGIYVYTETGVADPTRDIVIVNPHVDVDDKALRVEGAFVEIHGGILRSRKFGQMSQINSGKLILKGHNTFIPGGSADVNDCRMITVMDGIIDARGAEINVDLADIPSRATEFGIIELSGESSSSLTGGTWRIVNDTNMKSFLYKSGVGTHRAGGGIKLVTEKLGANPSSSMEVTGAALNIYTGAWSWEQAEGAGNTSNMVEILEADGRVLPLHHRHDKKVFVKLYASGANRVLGALPRTAPVGQTLVIVNAEPSYTITITAGHLHNTVLPKAENVVLSYGEALILTFDGTLWWAN